MFREQHIERLAQQRLLGYFALGGKCSEGALLVGADVRGH
jgi:hypothetical protein